MVAMAAMEGQNREEEIRRVDWKCRGVIPTPGQRHVTNTHTRSNGERRRVRRSLRRRPSGLGRAQRDDLDPLVTGRNCDGGRQQTVAGSDRQWRSIGLRLATTDDDWFSGGSCLSRVPIRL
ncbi:hypothetical protein LR48_Vigan03g085100 [Vigna angularis]|uniref:Uncharacterized protein n=1 Tax=Phaseolus angularis TaxID=3914 RepID=A0A0L9U514_PHAAN|nr:hypothetical protein LR48_Vigan03g085100 [Vigna angularis]